MYLYELCSNDGKWKKFFNGNAVFMPESEVADKQLCETLETLGMKVCGIGKYGGFEHKNMCRAYGEFTMFQIEFCDKWYYEKLGKEIILYREDAP